MGLLGELKQLRRFEHRDTVQQMGSEDFAWMKENFVKCENHGW